MELALETETSVWLGLDQSYGGFGIVVLKEDGTHSEYLEKFSVNKSEAYRLRRIYDFVYCVIDSQKQYSELITGEANRYIEGIAMEGYAHGAKFNREKLGELGGIVKLAIWDSLGIDPLIVAPTSLKKFVTGKGTASKEDMVASVNTKWNADIKDHNLADAYAIARYLKEHNEHN